MTIAGYGGPEQVGARDDLPPPELQRSTDALVRIQAGALNHLDLFVLGGLPHTRIEFPWIVGSDGAGIVERIGADVEGIAEGDHVMINPGVSCGECEYCTSGDDPLCLQFRIYGEHAPGTLCEYMVVPSRNLRTIPSSVPFEIAAAFPLATLTAWRMVHTKARIREGDHVLIWGIGGGVAQQSLRLCKAAGATVWVTSGSDSKLERARAMGADDTFNHETVDVGREVRARTGKRGVDVVIDNVGQASWKQSLGALGKRGRLVTCGATSGPLVETDVRRLFWNQWTIMGSTMGSQAEFDAIAGELRAGRCLPDVDSVHAFGHGADAYARLASGEQFGKVVVRVSEAPAEPARAPEAQYGLREEQGIRAAFVADGFAQCPSCGTRMSVRPIGGGSFGLGYARRRTWLLCPGCRRSVIFDVERGTRT